MMYILTFLIGLITGAVVILVILEIYRARIVHETMQDSNRFFKARLEMDERIIQRLDRIAESISHNR